MIALAIDDALALRLRFAQERVTADAGRSAPDRAVLQAGLRYETDADLPGIDAEYAARVKAHAPRAKRGVH